MRRFDGGDPVACLRETVRRRVRVLAHFSGLNVLLSDGEKLFLCRVRPVRAPLARPARAVAPCPRSPRDARAGARATCSSRSTQTTWSRRAEQPARRRGALERAEDRVNLTPRAARGSAARHRSTRGERGGARRGRGAGRPTRRFALLVNPTSGRGRALQGAAAGARDARRAGRAHRACGMSRARRRPRVEEGTRAAAAGERVRGARR